MASRRGLVVAAVATVGLVGSAVVFGASRSSGPVELDWGPVSGTVDCNEETGGSVELRNHGPETVYVSLPGRRVRPLASGEAVQLDMDGRDCHGYVSAVDPADGLLGIATVTGQPAPIDIPKASAVQLEAVQCRVEYLNDVLAMKFTLSEGGGQARLHDRYNELLARGLPTAEKALIYSEVAIVRHMAGKLPSTAALPQDEALLLEEQALRDVCVIAMASGEFGVIPHEVTSEQILEKWHRAMPMDVALPDSSPMLDALLGRANSPITDPPGAPVPSPTPTPAVPPTSPFSEPAGTASGPVTTSGIAHDVADWYGRTVGATVADVQCSDAIDGIRMCGVAAVDSEGANILITDTTAGAWVITYGTGFDSADPARERAAVVEHSGGPGLFCRDLEARGDGPEAAVSYWLAEGRPDRMDADLDGVPCGLVWDPAVIQADLDLRRIG